MRVPKNVSSRHVQGWGRLGWLLVDRLQMLTLSQSRKKLIQQGLLHLGSGNAMLKQGLATPSPVWLCWWPDVSRCCQDQHKQTFILKPLLPASLWSLLSLHANMLSSSSTSNSILMGPRRPEPKAATHAKQRAEKESQ